MSRKPLFALSSCVQESNPLKFYILLGVVALFSSLPFAVGQQGLDWRHAGDLIQAGNYAGALKESERLLAERPNDVLLLRFKGICRMETGHQDEAVTVLRRAVTLNPNSIASRFYLAQALAYQGGAVEASDLLREIQRMAPDSEYARRAAAVLPDLENLRNSRQAMPAQKRWDVTLRVAGEYDDNVPARASQDPNIPQAASFRLVTAADLEFRPLDQNLDQTPITLGVGYSFYQSLHERSSLEGFDLTSNSGRLYLQRSGQTAGMPYKARLTGHYTDDQLGGNQFDTSEGLRSDLDLQLSDWAVLAPFYSADWKNFRNKGNPPSQFSRDGLDQSIGFNQYFYTFHNKLVLSVGYAYRWADTDGQEFQLSSHQLNSSATVALPWKLNWVTSLAYANEDYLDFTPTPRRINNVITVSTVLSRPLWNPNVTADASYSYTTSLSTRTDDYKRNIIGLGLTYHF